MFGTAELPANFLHLYFGYFIGGGLVLNNYLYDGPSGNAPGPSGRCPSAGRGRPRQLIELASIHVLERGLPDGRILTDADEWDIPATLLDPWLDQAARSAAHAIAAAPCWIWRRW